MQALRGIVSADHIIECTETQHIAVFAEAADLTFAYGSDNGFFTESVAAVDVGNMYLDNGDVHCRNSITDSVAVMGVSACIQHYAAFVQPCGVNAVDDLALVVGLPAFAGIEAQLCGALFYLGADAVVGVISVDPGFTLAQQIEVGAVYYKNIFHFIFILSV